MWREQEETVVCSMVDKPVLQLSLLADKKIHVLLDAYPATEWAGYMTGKRSGCMIQVEDIVIPPHEEATTASAVLEAGNEPPDCVGFIHSHNVMGAFHSATDNDHVDMNYPVSLTVANRNGILEYSCVSMTSTPCGHKTLSNVTVMEAEDLPMMTKFIATATANIEKNMVKHTHNIGCGGLDIHGIGGCIDTHNGDKKIDSILLNGYMADNTACNNDKKHYNPKLDHKNSKHGKSYVDYD